MAIYIAFHKTNSRHHVLKSVLHSGNGRQQRVKELTCKNVKMILDIWSYFAKEAPLIASIWYNDEHYFFSILLVMNVL